MTPEEEHPGPMPGNNNNVSQNNNSNNVNIGASGDSSLSEGPSPSAEFGSSLSSPLMQLPTQPGNRGGHQMVIDCANQVRQVSFNA
jgi:hypothetical protein